MKRNTILIMTFMILFSVMLSVVFFPENAFASSSMYVNVSRGTIYPGEKVTVTVGVDPSLKMIAIDTRLTFNPAVVDYSGGSSAISADITLSGSDIYIAKTAGASFTAGVVATLTFTAKASGKADFRVDSGSGGTLEAVFYNFSGGSASVSVENAPAATPATTAATTAPAQTPLAPVETIAPSTTATTAESTTTGTTKPFKAVDYAGRSLSLAEAELEDLQLPGGFDPEEQIINGNRLSGFYSEEEDLFIAFLNRPGEEPCFYYYDSGCRSFIPYLRFALNEESYHVAFMPEDLMPHGTSRSSAVIKGLELPVLEFNSGEYILLDDYMRQYQDKLAENEAGEVDSHQTSSFSTETVTPIDVELDANNNGLFLIALRGKDKKIERFFYSEKIDQLLHYDLLMVPAFGTFLDKDFYEKTPEKLDNPALQNETRTVTATTTTVPASSEQTESLLAGTVNLFGNNFKLWQIIVAAVVLLLIVVIVIIVIIRAVSRRGRAEYPFSEDFLANDPKQISENAHTYVDDDLDAENFRPSDYTYPDDFPEVSELSDTDLEEDYFNEDYQANQYSEKSEQEDQEEI